MLRQYVNMAEIDAFDPTIRYELEIDLRRMDKLRHEYAPENADAYRVKVTPSTQTYRPGFHRFRFEIQYGKLSGDRFEPLSDLVRYQSETLPMI